MTEPPLALITGASRGIGAAVVRSFINHGYDVAAVVRRADSLNELQGHATASGRRLLPIVTDLTDASRVNDLVGALTDAHRIDVLVNNAGIIRDGLALRLKDDDYIAVWETNFLAAVRLDRLCLKGMLKRRYGRIIHLSSVSAERGNAGQSAYTAAKAALNGYARSVAKEMASRGITINAVAPGFIDTDMTSELREEWRQRLLRHIPLRRFGSAAEVAEVVQFLASTEAAYVTGQVIEVSGGL